MVGWCKCGSAVDAVGGGVEGLVFPVTITDIEQRARGDRTELPTSYY